VLALFLSLWQTSIAFYQGSIAANLQGIHNWLLLVLKGGYSNDDSIFLFFIIALTFLLAYASSWLLYRTRIPWLVVVLNAVVLLINLNYVTNNLIIFLIIFLLASLLLLLRFNLYESIQRWHRQGLRYSDGLGWDVMQTGTLLSIGILIFSWVLPSSYIDPTTSQLWTSKSSPLVQLEDTWNRIFSINGGSIPANHGNFQNTLALGGNPNLTQEIVFRVNMNSTNPQYLGLISYDTYTTYRGWSIEHTLPTTTHVAANTPNEGTGLDTVDAQQTVTVVNPPGDQNNYLVGASEITTMSVPANLLTEDSGTIAWIGDNSSLNAGSHYTVTSAISAADIATLQSVPMPADSPSFNPAENPNALPPVNYFDPQILKDYNQLPSDLDPRIHKLALQIVKNAHAKTMYDDSVAIETYLRSHYTYSTNIHPKSGEDPAAWFLFDNPAKDGFCNYYSSAMTLMLRSLGIPTRVVAGYTYGHYDNKQFVVRGTDAHSWVQVYFAGYGWINFEPSASFKTFTRPTPATASSIGSTNPTSPNGSQSTSGSSAKKNRPINEPGGSSSSAASSQAQSTFDQGFFSILGAIVLLLLLCALIFELWWRRLFRRHSLATQLYGRVGVLANLAGLRVNPSQTPYEYIRTVSLSALPAENDTLALERIGDIYVRERWADPASTDNPVRTGETRELPLLWQKVRPRLFLYVLRHPSFLRAIPNSLQRFLTGLRTRRKKHNIAHEDL
jgi:transglutaminase-like putative cysteine protease